MADWQKVAQIDEIDVEEPLIVTAGEDVIALYNVDGGIFATSGICSHEEECLEGGYVEDGTVECPFHSAVFSIKTGEHLEGPGSGSLSTYPVQLEGQNISIDMAGKLVGAK